MLGSLRFPIAAVAVLAVATCAPAAPVPADGKNIALPFPSKAPLVVQINGFERARDRLSKMLEALPPAEGKQVKAAIEGGLKHLLAGRKLTAVPADARLFVVVHDFAKLVEDEPAISVLVPVSGYSEFKDTFLTAAERKAVEKGGAGIESVKSSATGDELTLYMVDLKGYVVVSPSKELAEVYGGKYERAQAGSMGPDLSASFLNADVALFVNMDVINDKYGEQIRQFKGLIDFALGQAQMNGMIPGLKKNQIEVVKVVLNGFVQAIEDSQGLVIAAEFRAEGLNLRGQAKFSDDSSSASVLKLESPGPLAELAKLPRGLGTYAGTKFGKKFADLGRQLTQEFAAADDDEKGAAQIEKLVAELAAAGPKGDFAASSVPELGLSLASYQNPEKAAAAYIKLYKAMAAGSKFASIVLKETPKVTEAAQSYRGFAFAEVRLTMDFAASVESFPENIREATLNSLKRMMKEKAVFWTGTDGKVVVHLTAKDWEGAKKLLDGYLDGKTAVGGEAGFNVARKNLPAEATAIFLVETGQVLIAMIEQVKTAAAAIPGGLPVPIGTPKPVAGEPTYIGIAVAMKAQVATLDGFFSGGAMNVATRILVPLFRNVE